MVIEYGRAVYHFMACGSQEWVICGDERDRKLRYLLPTNQGVAGSRLLTAEAPAKRGEDNPATR
jgi:hypothetical protein